MSANEEIIIRAILAGTREYLANSQQVVAGNEEIAASTDATGRAMERATRRGYLMNQALFTVRRLMYGVTLATIGSGVAALKWGFDFNSAMQSARVALGPLQSATFSVNKELDYLFNFTKYTPFQFKDITTAFRQMYGAMSPLGISAQDVNGYIKAMVDALSFAGRTTPGALNRVAVALQHVAFQGRLTGQSVTQLARDGLPVYAALHKELGLTADQMHQIGKLNIPTNVALKALHDYIESTPGYMNAAHRQAVNTFHGLFTTFKDNTSQLMGYVEAGWFHRMQDNLMNMNHWFDRIGRVAHDSGGNLNAIMAAIAGPGAVMLWHRLVDVIHQFWVLFTTIAGTLIKSRAVWLTVYAALTAISVVLHIINPVLQAMGGILWIIIPLWITYKTVTTAAAIATAWYTLSQRAGVTVTKDMTFAEWLLTWARRTGISTMIYERYIMISVYAQMRIMEAASYAWTAAIYVVYTAQGLLTAGMTAFGEAMIWVRTQAAILWLVLELNPIILILTAVLAVTAGLVVLYYKWKTFRELVNYTWHDLIYFAPLVAGALTLAFGPLGLALTTLMLIIRYWGQLPHNANPAHLAQNNFKGKTDKGWMGTLEAAAMFGPTLAGKIWHGLTHLASGGQVIGSGLSWVGENGPELLSLPVGAQVIPRSQAFNYGEAWMRGGNHGETRIIRVQIGRKVIAEIVAEEIASQQARA